METKPEETRRPTRPYRQSPYRRGSRLQDSWWRRWRAGLGLRAGLLLAVGMGLSSGAAASQTQIILDWFPNADHVPLYVGREQGFFAAAGLQVELIPPSDPSDALKLVAVGQAAYGISYQPSVYIARAEGLPIKAVGVLVARPLTSLAYLEGRGIRSPADLKGKRIGYALPVPQLGLLHAVMGHHGVEKEAYRTVNVGFNLTQALLTKQVDAVIGAFWNYELAEFELEGVAGSYFALEDHGVPSYSELVLVTSDAYLVKQKAQAAKLVRALQKSIDWTRAHPREALALYFKANPQVRQPLDRKAFAYTLPVFARSQRQDLARWRRFGEFALKQGIISTPLDASQLFVELAP